jgi:hypothetical protein
LRPYFVLFADRELHRVAKRVGGAADAALDVFRVVRADRARAVRVPVARVAGGGHARRAGAAAWLPRAQLAHHQLRVRVRLPRAAQLDQDAGGVRRAQRLAPRPPQRAPLPRGARPHRRQRRHVLTSSRTTAKNSPRLILRKLGLEFNSWDF